MFSEEDDLAQILSLEAQSLPAIDEDGMDTSIPPLLFQAKFPITNQEAFDTLSQLIHPDTYDFEIPFTTADIPRLLTLVSIDQPVILIESIRHFHFDTDLDIPIQRTHPNSHHP